MPIHPQNPDDEHTPSTTWRWERRRVPAPPAGQRRRASEASATEPSAAGQKRKTPRYGWRHFPTYPLKRRKEFLTLRIKYSGGPEAWYVVHARGSTGRFPGVSALHDVMQDIYNCSDLEGAPRMLKMED